MNAIKKTIGILAALMLSSGCIAISAEVEEMTQTIDSPEILVFNFSEIPGFTPGMEIKDLAGKPFHVDLAPYLEEVSKVLFVDSESDQNELDDKVLDIISRAEVMSITLKTTEGLNNLDFINKVKITLSGKDGEPQDLINYEKTPDKTLADGEAIQLTVNADFDQTTFMKKLLKKKELTFKVALDIIAPQSNFRLAADLVYNFEFKHTFDLF